MKKAGTPAKTQLFVRSNLSHLMGDKISATDLHRYTGVPQPTIHRILSGESDDPKTGTLKPIADYFGISVSDLRSRDFGAGDSPISATENAALRDLVIESVKGVLEEVSSEFRMMTVYRLADSEHRKIIDIAVAQVVDSLGLETLLNKRKGRA